MLGAAANAFRTNGVGEKVMLDFGLNLANPPVGQENRPDLVFRVNQKVVMNYYTAKCLAIVRARRQRRSFALGISRGLPSKRAKRRTRRSSAWKTSLYANSTPTGNQGVVSWEAASRTWD